MEKNYEVKSNFNADINEDSNIFLNIVDDSNIKYTIKNCSCNIFVYIDCKNEVKENIDIVNSNVNYYYVELNNNDISFNSNINVYDGSNVNINTILLASNSKVFNFNITNIEKNSNCEIYNDVIGLDKADFSLNVIGNILKNSPYSKCIQKTHCLSIGKPSKLLILPILNIDNENVVASHSLSSGTVDDKIMYYLNARGLSNSEAIKLILKSYLSLPQNIIDIFSFANIADIFNSRVESLCLM